MNRCGYNWDRASQHTSFSTYADPGASPHTMIADTALKQLAEDIARSHGEASNSEVQTSIFMRCVLLLLLDDLALETHLFCNPSLVPIAGHTLIMFSFPGAVSKQRQVVEQRMARALELCPACVRGYHRCLHEMRHRFIIWRKIPVAQVLQFLDIVNKWELERVEERLARVELPTLAYQCLSNTWILRSNASLRTQLLRILNNCFYDHLLPSTVMYTVEGSPQELEYALAYMTQLRKGQHLDPQVIDEINYYFYRIQDAKHFSTDFSRRFWAMINVLCDVLDPLQIARLLKPEELEAMSAHTQIRLLPLIKVLFNNLMANLDAPLPVLLQVFQKLLSIYGSKFWEHAQDCNPANIVDYVLPNPHYQVYLHLAAINASAKYSLDELLNWMAIFVDTLAGSQKQAVAIKLSEFLVQRERAEQDNKLVDSTAILLKCFDFLSVGPNASVSLLKMRDARLSANKNSEYFSKLAKNESEGSGHAVDLVCSALRYDVLVALHNSTIVEKKQIPILSESNIPLWSAMTRIGVPSPFLSQKLLESLAGVLKVVVYKEKKSPDVTKEFGDALRVHNREAARLCSSISSMLDKLAMVDPDKLKSILSNDVCLTALWSCLLNPATGQAALDVVYQVYDAEGRYEAISSLLNQSLQLNLQAINKSMATVREMKVYEPCPKLLRVLMDVIKCLTDPLSGILNTQNSTHSDCKKEVKEFWDECWQLLVMIFQQTFVWAGLYHLSDLIEFTRDTLDTSHLLLDSFRVLLDYFADSSMNVQLFDAFMDAFNHVIVWLRLGDVSLLNSCVDLVFKGFDLAKDLQVNVDKNFIITFAKYGAKAKKFNNKLSEQQRLDILGKASEFDLKLVQYVVEEAAKDRSLVRSASPATTTATDREPKTAAYAYQTHSKGPKQLTLSRFGVVTDQAPVAPPPPKPFKANNLEAIRNELKSTRTPSKAPINPAPPRPAGFNSKATAVGRSLNTLKHRKVDSESSDDEEDVDTSDLFLDSKKKSKIIELDMKGRPITKVAVAKKVDQQRREEERMRMRLNVNLKPLYTTVLKWNYNSNSEFPTEDRDIYSPIKDSYSDVKDYVSQIEPLLMLECWQGIQSSRTTGQEVPFELLVGSRTTVDGFFDVYVSIKKSELSARKIGETDLLVLGYVADKGFNSPNEISSYLKKPGSQTCFGKVREIKYANADFCDITVRVYPQGSMMGLLTPKTLIVAMKVMQMITVEREYSSLKGLQYYDLCDEILSAKPAKPVQILEKEALNLCSQLNVNISQAKAIIGSHHSEGFSLIQGPPGTGKTKTILGIVGHFLSKKTTSSAVPVTVSHDPRASTPPEDKKPVAKVLICAPSNAAVDELVVRLRNGVLNDKGETTIPKIVRLGRGDAINVAVRDLGLEELIERQIQVRNGNTSIDPNIRLEHNKCIAERDQIREALRGGKLSEKETTEMETRLREVNKKRSELGRRLDEQRESASIAQRTRDIERRQLQAKILSEAQVICSTLSGSAHDFLASMSMKFDQVIIDEACQCVELSAIIPLRYGCKKCVMVGDPNQLPPTVLSQKAASFNYEESLFVRMQRNNPQSIYLLDVQYRMHPEISKFPSAQFYDSKLADGAGMLQLNQRPWHQDFPLSPYRFFDILSRHQQNERSKSFFNTSEARVALELVEKLMQILPSDNFKGRIGIISPYKEQIRTLRDTFLRKFGATIFNEIDFNTVDGFQGQEKEIIIMSCVRASEKGSVGFLSDVRRMNVALTRARTTLWILGNKTSLRRDKMWNKLITDAETRSCVTPAEPGFLRNVKRLEFETYGLNSSNTTSHPASIQPSNSSNQANAASRSIEGEVFKKHKKLSHPSGERDGTKKRKLSNTASDKQSASASRPSELRKSEPSVFIEKKSPTEKKKKPFVYKANPTPVVKPADTLPTADRSGSYDKPKPKESLTSTTGEGRMGPPPANNSGVYRPKPKNNAGSIFIKSKRPHRP